MYRSMIYFLSGSFIFAVTLSIIGVLELDPRGLLLGAVTIVALSGAANYLVGRIFNVKPNPESWLITALILSLTLGPLEITEYWPVFVVAATAAMLSKYVLVWQRQHLFNPAAVGMVAAAGITGVGASWWIGNPYLAVPTLIGGLVMAKKSHRLLVASVFILTYLLLRVALNVVIGPGLSGETLQFLIKEFSSSPLIFFAFIMVTEPMTSPTAKKNQYLFAGTLAVLIVFGQKFFGAYPYTFETALLLGNLLTKTVEPRRRFLLTLIKREQLTPTVFQFVFRPDRKPLYLAGQFAEFNLPHQKPDSRGTRRWFTLVSSPTEDVVKVAVRLTIKQGSSFKAALMALPVGGTVTISCPEGEFVLPADKKQKLLFVAGGIGVTPFRSIIRFLMDSQEKRDITLLYLARDKADFAFEQELQLARGEVGLKFIKWIEADNGRLSASQIRHLVADYKQRRIYISGPEPMVEGLEKLFINELGCRKSQLIQDYFPGYTDKLLAEKKAASPNTSG